MTAAIKAIFRRPPARPVSIETEEESPVKSIDFALLRRMLVNLKPYRWQYVRGISAAYGQLVSDLIGPAVVGTLINFVGDYVTQGPAHAPTVLDNVLRWFTGPFDPASLTQHQAVMYLLLLIAVWALSVAGSVFSQRFAILTTTRVGETVQFDYRLKLFNQLQRLDMSFYDKTKLGRIISRCTSDVNSMRETNVWGPAHMVIQSSACVFAAVILAVLDWRLFLAVAWLGPVLYVVNRFFLKKVALSWQIQREGFTRVSTNLAENITGMRVVTAFNRQNVNVTEFNRLQTINTANNVSTARVNGVYQPTLEVTRFIGRVVLLGYGGYLVASGGLSLGSVVAAYLYWDWFVNPIVFLGNFSNTAMQAFAGAERILALLDNNPAVYDLPDAKPLPRITGEVTFENVTFGYKPESPVLHDVSFTAKPGQMFALVGHTGSGKSSIISLIARFYQPQSGRVLVDGHDVRHCTGDSLHKQMGLVLQVNYLFSGTVLDNIRYAKPDATEEQVLWAAEELGTLDTINSLPLGLHTDVGERGANMSLGQRQLICFTRAYLADPRIFMLDEATSAVDTGTEQLVQRSLEKLLKNRTTFVVAHRLSTIRRADCILVIDHGHVIERGRHDELVALGGKYAQLYEQFSSHNA